MVIESLISPFKAEANPGKMWIYGFVYGTIGLLLGIWIFDRQASLVMVFLTTLAAVPLMYNTIKLEEQKDIKYRKESFLLKEHTKAISFFLFLFIGFTLAFAFWYVILPEQALQNGFNIQTQTLLDLSSSVTGGLSAKISIFEKIFFNNVKVLIFCILFSFIYGVGAIFILSWNASVIGAAMGNFIRTNLQKYASALGLTKWAGYFGVISVGLFKYSIHGIPEIAAYFFGGLAGGIISIAVIRHDFFNSNFEKIILDASDLMIISIVTLFIAALLEVFVTPIIF